MAVREFLSLGDAIEYLSPGDVLSSKSPCGSGGCINSTYLLTLKSGKHFFIKENNHSPVNMFREEALGLLSLSAKFPLKIPVPLAYGKEGRGEFLILEYIESSRPEKNFWINFAYGLAEMHKAGGSEKCGFTRDNYIGSTRQINRERDCWTDFFGENRLLYQVELARSRNLADSFIVNGVEKICSRLSSLLPEPEYPSILHGDLWSGNYMVDSHGRAVLIDPAVYYGHREADLAMTQLFGGFNSRFYEAYNEVYALEKGFEKRRDLYNLYHMLNHLNLFGSSYSGSVRSIVSAYL